MNHIQRYLTDEVMEDYAGGQLTRRDALRRLGLLGVAAATAAGLLAACTVDPAPAPAPAATGPGPSTGAPPSGSVTPQEITFAGPGRTLAGSFAAATRPGGAVVVIHDNRGLTDDTRAVAGYLAGSGYSALAVDLLSEEGGTAKVSTEAGAPAAALSRVPLDRFVADMRAGLTELEARVPGVKLGAVGFCFGGGMVWSLLDDPCKEGALVNTFKLKRCPS